ncbi:hypothetical protein Syun_029039 [Stephania yunnanensis]|uniref:S-adenosylmethionine decarboxylase proenzyme n=1 Tax=Stephania yunnanensis TaxID=152371 RepID=A0AAP0E780_9MAGN
MAVSGFEGFEKRLELNFSGEDGLIAATENGLRDLDFEVIQQVLSEVQCTVVSALSNTCMDSYVLSESSLFVYPTKIIIKTCGTTQLLKSIPLLVSHAHHLLGLHVTSCRYTRGSFIFPKSQPFPHTSFKDEVHYLNLTLPSHLCYRKARVLHPSKKSSSSHCHAWHVFCASDHQHAHLFDDNNNDERDDNGHDDHGGAFTMEVCMTDLDQGLAEKFFGGGEVTAREMTWATGIGEINPNQVVCDFAFDPCGYSMNGIDGGYYSTIHVTPEEGFSYASFECNGELEEEILLEDGRVNVYDMLEKVVQVFRPAKLSVAMTGATRSVSTRLRSVVESFGLTRRSCSGDDQFPGSGKVVFQTFSTSRRK